ncbi:CHAP domain-containing protein [Homoserinibacter sp. GY 40078]|uniref:CHAP domain-containing protein n=1 Tax=Homoserinibacter sp. GY 40078 TaxID=2603275 RepID=UPI0011CB8D27|nr:CHAP domain-containing protein [Homoserinibacter sp. GY 40078]TXK19289.1 CHAP domain-containing protein [Homoserinibacter sp. GY 40078]
MDDEHGETIDPRLSRRTLLGGAAAIATLASLGIDLASPGPAFAVAAPVTPEGVIAYARKYLGLDLDGVKASEDPPDGAWAGYNGDWCAWFATWCLRGLGLGKRTLATNFEDLPLASTPAVGDLVIFTRADGNHHVAIVTQTSGGLRSIDGNRSNIVKEDTFIEHVAKEYRRPPYQSVEEMEAPPVGVLVKSETSGTYYFVEEFRVTQLANQAEAIPYSKVYGTSTEVGSGTIQAMQAHAADNRSVLVAEIVAAINNA